MIDEDVHSKYCSIAEAEAEAEAEAHGTAQHSTAQHGILTCFALTCMGVVNGVRGGVGGSGWLMLCFLVDSQRLLCRGMGAMSIGLKMDECFVVVVVEVCSKAGEGGFGWAEQSFLGEMI